MDDPKAIKANGNRDAGTAAEQSISPPGLKATSDREKRVAQLRQQHVEGTYQVDAAQVSARIVDSHLNK